MTKKKTSLPLTCPTCQKTGFRAPAALRAHVKAMHPEAGPGSISPDTYEIRLVVPKLPGPGQHALACPLCRQKTMAWIKADGTIGTSDDVPKQEAASSSTGKTRGRPKVNVHPLFIKPRFDMRWNKKENRWKYTVAMSGTHGRSAVEMPWREPGIEERWLLNDAHGIEAFREHVEAGRVTRWWQMHHRWRVTRRHTRYASDHWQWLQDVRTVPRIVMQRKFKEVPNSEGFKFHEITEMLLGDKLGRGAGYVQYYYTNTFSYMFAQLIYEKKMGIHDWERVELYGCELEQLETEYFRQRPGLEFWFGMAVEAGIEIYVPESCFMLFAQDVRANERGQSYMAQYPNYMAYGYLSPSLAEAKERNEMLGVDPVEENVIGAWDSNAAIDHTYAFNDSFVKLMQRSLIDFTPKEVEDHNEWLDQVAEAK